MPFLMRTVKYPSLKQAEFWILRRNNRPTLSTIAIQRKISLAAVSQTLKEANSRVKNLLESTAKSNKIRLTVVSPELGYARGRSREFKVTAYITYSPVNGVHVWYDHEGDCEACEEADDCRQLLLQEYQERNLPIPAETLPATELGERLFQRLEALLK